MCKLIGYLYPNKKALQRSDYCLEKCKKAWFDKVWSLDQWGPEMREFYRLEKLWSKRHIWFLNIAYRKSAFEKGK